MEEVLIEEESEILIQEDQDDLWVDEDEAHVAAPDWFYKEQEVCPICGRTDCGWI